MRCVAGLVLFFVLYICLCTILRGYVQNTYGELAAADVIRKYHALVAVAAGAASLVPAFCQAYCCGGAKPRNCANGKSGTADPLHPTD